MKGDFGLSTLGSASQAQAVSVDEQARYSIAVKEELVDVTIWEAGNDDEHVLLCYVVVAEKKCASLILLCLDCHRAGQAPLKAWYCLKKWPFLARANETDTSLGLTNADH